MYFNSFSELNKYLESDKVKILELYLTEEQIAEKYPELKGKSSFSKYYKNYIYVDLEDNNIINKCYRLHMAESDIDPNNVEGLPDLNFIYKTNIPGLKAIVLDISPASEEVVENANEKVTFTEVNKSSYPLNLYKRKAVKGFEPKEFVKDLSDSNLDLYYTTRAGMTIYFAYESGHSRNTEYESEILDFIKENIKVIEIK